MKVTFKDSNLQFFEDDQIILELDYIPKVGESVFFDQSIVPETYLDFVKRHGFIIKDEEAEDDDSFGTVKADVQSVHHIFKPGSTGHTVEIEIDFSTENSNGSGEDPEVG